jgi:sister-chromatid-cohesion protein PDS5
MELDEPLHELPGLQFNEPLSWRAGKPIAIADLLRRLQALSKEMKGMEQEENERESFTTVAKELASPNLLGHKDKGVRAWTACSLVEILRLCAPDAPYTGQQLKVGQHGVEFLI